jgi:hypothetical protein
MLGRGVGIDQLVSAAKQAYVKAAISEFFPHGSRINISRLSVTTGLTRKEAAALVNRMIGGGKEQPIRQAKEQRAMRVLRGWCIDPRFRGQGGHPAKLSLRGSKKSFALLVKLYGGDVTPISVLRELQRMNTIATTRDGLLRIRGSSRQFSAPAPAPRLMAEFATLLADFAGAISQHSANGSPPAYFGYRDFDSASMDDAAAFERTFSRRAAALLDGFDEWRTSRRKPRNTSGELSRVGVGVYLIKSSATPPDPARMLRRRRRPRSPP